MINDHDSRDATVPQQIKKQCLNNFLRRATDKVRDTGSLKRKEGYGRNELSLAKAKNKETWDE